MRLRSRTGDWVMTSVGRTWRITRDRSRRSVRSATTRPSPVAEEDERLDAHLLGGPRLLDAAHRGHLRTGDGEVEPARVTIGDEAVGDVDACVGQHRHGAGGTEVDVVGMCGDDQRPFDLGGLQHATSLRGVFRTATLRVGARETVHVRSSHVGRDEPTGRSRACRSGSFDLSVPEFWLAPRDYREGAFHALRQLDHLVFSTSGTSRTRRSRRAPGTGRSFDHEDVWFVSRNPYLFISGKGSNIADLPIEMAEFFGSMIAMDDPRALPPAVDRVEGLHAEGDQPGRGLREDQGRGSWSTGCSSGSPRANATSSARSPLRCRCRSSAR